MKVVPQSWADLEGIRYWVTLKVVSTAQAAAVMRAAGCRFTTVPSHRYPHGQPLHINNLSDHVTYNSHPPSTGYHFNTPALWGNYSQPVDAAGFERGFELLVGSWLLAFQFGEPVEPSGEEPVPVAEQLHRRANERERAEAASLVATFVPCSSWFCGR
jgi:hypothetical protein